MVRHLLSDYVFFAFVMVALVSISEGFRADNVLAGLIVAVPLTVLRGLFRAWWQRRSPGQSDSAEH